MNFKVFVFFCSIFETVLSLRCGSDVKKFTSTRDEITSPGYPTSYYENNMVCDYRIKVGDDRKIVLDFVYFQTEKGYDFLTIFDGDSMAQPMLGQFSGDQKPSQLTSSGNQLFIKFTTDGGTHALGFKLKYHTIYTGNCGGNLTQTIGTFQSPDYPNKYPYDMNCTWTIEGPVKSFIILNFIDFETESGHDFLEVYDGSLPDNRLISNYSGVERPKNLLSYSSNILILRFIADENGEKRGFNISYNIKGAGFDEGMAYITTPYSLIDIGANNSVYEHFVAHFNDLKKVIPNREENSYLFSLYSLFSNEFQIYSSNEMTFSYKENVEDFDYDSIHGLIFWININKRVIEVLDINHQNVYTLFNFTAQSKELKVNERKSVLIWSIIGLKPQIISSNYDGTNQLVLYSKSRQSFHLTVDYQRERYYFIDIKDYSLYSIDFNGDNEEYYMSSETLFDSLNSISLLNNDFYLCNKQMVYRITEIQSNISKAEILFKSYIFDKTLQKNPLLKDNEYFEIDSKVIKRKEFNYLYIPETDTNSTNKCLSSQCSHLCLPIGDAYRCVCPSQHILVNDIKCVPKFVNQNNINREINSKRSSTERRKVVDVSQESTSMSTGRSPSTISSRQIDNQNQIPESMNNTSIMMMEENEADHKEQNELISDRLAQLQTQYSEIKYSSNSYTISIVNSGLIVILTFTIIIITYLAHRKFTRIEETSFRRNDGNLPLLELENDYAQIETLKNKNQKAKHSLTKI